MIQLTKPAGNTMKTETASEKEKQLMKDEQTERARLHKRREQRQREVSEKRSARLETDHIRHSQAFASETPQQHEDYSS